jgi:hypothetical protein
MCTLFNFTPVNRGGVNTDDQATFGQKKSKAAFVATFVILNPATFEMDELYAVLLFFQCRFLHQFPRDGIASCFINIFRHEPGRMVAIKLGREFAHVLFVGRIR